MAKRGEKMNEIMDEILEEYQVIDKKNYLAFLKNNGLTKAEYSFDSYEMDMIKERAKDFQNFNAKY